MPSFERCVVLVADDEPLVLRLVTGVLTRHGYIVISAMDGQSALEACLQREGPIHLAVLDVMMPGMTGPELAECLKEHHPKIDVLFMSGFRTDQIADIAPSIQKAHFIAKPFLPRDLVMRVNSILGNTDVCILLDDEMHATRG
jgi:two-component system, cell cycle sensor histidine kinase and response regulator CckA